jgi:hypothetical protein
MGYEAAQEVIKCMGTMIDKCVTAAGLLDPARMVVRVPL